MDGMTLPPSPMQALQVEHERLLGRLDDTGGSPCPGPPPPPIEELSFETQALIHEARAYIERCRAEAEWVSDSRDRSQLRANLRFWASFLLNCTGSFPDTTLRPARPFLPELSGLPKPPVSNPGMVETAGRSSLNAHSLDNSEPSGNEQMEDLPEEDAPEDSVETFAATPTWSSRFSRFIGLFAILIVGIVPLAAVCLALSLFYNLDNANPWILPGNAATQTATAATLRTTATPGLATPSQPSPTVGPLLPDQSSDLRLLVAEVTFGKSPTEETGCTPVLMLSLDAPSATGGTPIPPGQVVVSSAGADGYVLQENLEPGAAPLSLRLEEKAPGQTNLDWLVQVNHPWLGIETVILPGILFENCAHSEISVTYRPVEGAEVWQQALETASSNNLNLSWKLLTWGPDALDGQEWVAVMKLQASGGNENYLYFARGDLAAPAGVSQSNGLLVSDQVVLGQERCASAMAQVGVTSAGQSLNRALAVRLVMPDCR